MADDSKPTDELAARRGKRKTGPEVKANPVSGGRRAEAARRSADALQLRMAGATLQQVADQVGYATPSGAHQAIMRGLKTILPEETRAEARRLEVARLDRLVMGHWQAALAGDEKSANVCLRAIKMKVDILGLAAPLQVDMKVRDGEPVRIEILDVINEETLDGLRAFQDRMVELTELRAGAIDVEAEEIEDSG